MKTFRSWLRLGTLGGVVFASVASAQPEQWLQYHTGAKGRGYRYLDLTTNAPAGVALPKLEGQPYFARWKTPLDPNGGRWLCLDRTRKSGLWDRLYLDTTGNGRLDDKSPVVAAQRDQYSASFDPVRVVFKGEDGPLTYHLALRFMNYGDKSIYLMSSSAGWYDGLVDFVGKKHRVQLIDGTVNGTFNDLSLNPSDADRISVAGDKAGERYLGRLLEVDGAWFRIEVPRDGAFVKVQKAGGLVFGQVRVPENISEFTAVGENGQFIRKPESGQFTLPAGTYRVLGWTISRKDDKGVAWTLKGSGFNAAANFVVAAGQTATLDVGEPVTSVLQAAEVANSISFGLRLRGKLGESIEMLRGTERPRGPRLALASVDGTYRATNTFEFG